ncbi:MAG TPA: hypothetical protein VJ725_08155 [Thermoanaerobaculia bacterium]|nr:hypothetical protein [Thermoanaerobaculia bacterium]
MDDRPIDLRALDPTLDRERWERRIASITALAAPELARRAALAGSPAQVLLGWFRPALSAAAALALCAVVVLALLARSAEARSTRPAIAAEALRLPTPVAQLLGEERAPSLSEISLAMGEEDRP